MKDETLIGLGSDLDLRRKENERRNIGRTLIFIERKMKDETLIGLGSDLDLRRKENETLVGLGSDLHLH